MKKIYQLIIWISLIAITLIFSEKNKIIFTDEILFEEASYQMATTGNWLVPKLEEGSGWKNLPSISGLLPSSTNSYRPLP